MSKSPLISRTFNLSSVYVYSAQTAEVITVRPEPKKIDTNTNRPLSAILARISR